MRSISIQFGAASIRRTARVLFTEYFIRGCGRCQGKMDRLGNRCRATANRSVPQTLAPLPTIRVIGVAAGLTRMMTEELMAVPANTETERQSFAESALRLSGKTEEEARRTGAMDK